MDLPEMDQHFPAKDQHPENSNLEMKGILQSFNITCSKVVTFVVKI